MTYVPARWQHGDDHDGEGRRLEDNGEGGEGRLVDEWGEGRRGAAEHAERPKIFLTARVYEDLVKFSRCRGNEDICGGLIGRSATDIQSIFSLYKRNRVP